MFEHLGAPKTAQNLGVYDIVHPSTGEPDSFFVFTYPDDLPSGVETAVKKAAADYARSEMRIVTYSELPSIPDTYYIKYGIYPRSLDYLDTVIDDDELAGARKHPPPKGFEHLSAPHLPPPKQTHTYEIMCPRCEEGTLVISVFYQPEEDVHSEIMEKTCQCGTEDMEEYYDELEDIINGMTIEYIEFMGLEHLGSPSRREEVVGERRPGGRGSLTFEHLGTSSRDVPMACELCGSIESVTDDYGPQTICRDCIRKIEFSKLEHYADIWGDDIMEFVSDVKSSAVFAAAKAFEGLKVRPSKRLRIRTGATKFPPGFRHLGAPEEESKLALVKEGLESVRKAMVNDYLEAETMMTWHPYGSTGFECAKCVNKSLGKHLQELDRKVWGTYFDGSSGESPHWRG